MCIQKAMPATLAVVIGTLVGLLWCASLPSSVAAVQTTDDEQIDFERARGYLQKRQREEKLTDVEAEYLKNAIKARERRQGVNGGARNQVPRESVGLKPLSEMTADDRYEDEDGGLYGEGRNEPPEGLRQTALKAISGIEPLDAGGLPAADGRIVFISISMSNATQEFSRFRQVADKDPRRAASVSIVDCAQGGQAMAEWVPEDARPWREANRRIQAARMTPEQVQVAWIKLANKSPVGTLDEHGRKLHSDALVVLQNAKLQFPNLRIVYLSSRIYGGYASGGLNPEPFAYESAFVVRWLIQDQMGGNPELNADPENGPVKSPLLLWGPYLWADGMTPRASDQLIYARDDLARDGTHPSEAGREKVARQLLKFFAEDPLAAPWFAGR